MELKDKKVLLERVSKGGKIFTVEFIKKDGTKRLMNCRKGVVKHLHGVGNKSNSEGYDNLMVVYDLHSEGYRTINIDTLLSVKGGGETINLQGDNDNNKEGIK